MTLLFRKPSNS